MTLAARDERRQTERGERDRKSWGWKLQLGLVIALLMLLASFFVWRYVLEPARATRRPFVGTWRLESPVFSKRPELSIEIDLMSDGTVRDRVWDPRTGVIDYEQVRPVRWEVSDGRIREFANDRPLLELINGVTLQQGWDHRIVWEDPDRLRLEDALSSRPTMVWVRCRRQ